METLSLCKPHLIVMVGIPGSGKSFFAERFAETFKAPIISSERLRKDIFKSLTFSKDEEKIVDDIANDLLDQVLKTERTVAYDGNVYSLAGYDLIAKKTKKFGYEPLYVWVQTDQVTAQKRAIKPVVGKQIINAAQFDTKLKRFCPPEKTRNFIVISGKHTYASQLKIVLKYLAEPR